MFAFTFSFKLALISKGLRLPAADWVEVSRRFQACPDFKGIKTRAVRGFCFLGFQACPDFKGIKTPLALFGGRRVRCFKLALISKGLRPMACAMAFSAMGFKLALISKGLRPQLEPKIKNILQFQACPDPESVS